MTTKNEAAAQELGIRVMDLRAYGAAGWRWVESSEFGIRALRTDSSGEGVWTQDGRQVAGHADFYLPASRSAAYRAARKYAVRHHYGDNPLGW